ncbi:hypothetical protein E5F05_15375 [Deinococcus metallilatus]|uniref:ester cyclase n=1 Tax=Deinococcus metallilatus TaxID=1211322 RepID=UPI0010C52E5C|nr:ester cyclase [Deinococcus metallilatus]QBY09211.1 hypothetical protein E5F05_15375 [Deinococcus metallilatus]
MSAELNRQLAMQTLERAFNQGDVSVFDEVIPARGVDHQETPGTDMLRHLRDTVSMMRRAFPDLHFEVHHVLAEGDIVAFHSTMTGTHLGRFDIGPFRELPPPAGRSGCATCTFCAGRTARTPTSGT